MADRQEVKEPPAQQQERDNAVAVATAKLIAARREISEALQMLELAAN